MKDLRQQQAGFEEIEKIKGSNRRLAALPLYMTPTYTHNRSRL